MSNVIPLRKNQPFLVGNKVHMGESKTVFEVAGLGICGPVSSEFMGCKGKMINASEFVQLKVPGTERSVFNIHSSFLRHAT